MSMMRHLFATIAFVLLATAGFSQVRVDNGRFYNESGEFYTGEYTEQADGLTTSSITVVKGMAHGKVTYFHKNQSKKETGTYQFGKKHGIWKRWNQEGNLVAEASYLNGKKDGTWIVWDDNGVKRYEMHYSNGEKSGMWRMWDNNGTLVQEIKK